MSNETKQTAADLFAERTFNLIELMKHRYVNQEEFLDGMLKARNEAKETEREQMIDFAIWLLKGAMSEEEAKPIANAYYKEFYNETYGGNK